MDVKWTDLYKSIISNAAILGIPASGFFELTARCNFRCRMCYICSLPDNKEFFENELTAEQWITIGREARDAGLFLLTLTGGEIFMRKDFWEIYDAYSEMGFKLTLYTNSSLITAEKAHRLAKKPPSKVSITIYGSSPEMYGIVTGHPEAYESTITAIKSLIAEGITVDLKTTVIKQNKGEFEKIADVAGSMGIDLGLVSYISPRREGSGTDPEECRLQPEELAEYEKKAEMYISKLKNVTIGEKKSSIIIGEDTMANFNNVDIKEESSKKNDAQTAFRCPSGKCGFWFTWDGKLTPCGLISDPYTEPLKLGFLNAWEQLKLKCGYVPVCEECMSCKIRSECLTCPARLKIETGCFNKPAPYLCEYTKARIEIATHN